MTKTDKTLLMLRAREQAIEFVTSLDARITAVYEPMVEIIPMENVGNIQNTRSLIFTSSNAVRLFRDLQNFKHTNIYCVGTITASALEQAGCKNIHLFNTATDLVSFFQSHDLVKEFTYLRAKKVSVDIAYILQSHGYVFDEVILYQQKLSSLSRTASNIIESGPVILPVLSKELAKKLRDDLANLTPYDLKVICISPSVAKTFDDLDGIHVKIAWEPTRKGVIDKIRENL